jgi:MFS family permease
METTTGLLMDSARFVHLVTAIRGAELTDSPQAIMSNVFLGGFDGTITASTYAVISSEFNAANTASWLTTSYLITSTAFQPLYGRFSDILGRRACFFTATLSFMTGCLGCAIAQDIVFLNIMRALTGIGGGGLMTMGTLKMIIS